MAAVVDRVGVCILVFGCDLPSLPCPFLFRQMSICLYCGALHFAPTTPSLPPTQPTNQPPQAFDATLRQTGGASAAAGGANERLWFSTKLRQAKSCLAHGRVQVCVYGGVLGFGGGAVGGEEMCRVWTACPKESPPRPRKIAASTHNTHTLLQNTKPQPKTPNHNPNHNRRHRRRPA